MCVLLLFDAFRLLSRSSAAFSATRFTQFVDDARELSLEPPEQGHRGCVTKISSPATTTAHMMLCQVLATVIVATGAGVFALTNPQGRQIALPLPGGSFLEVDHELPGPDLSDGSPTKLYSLSLGRAWHNHTESAGLSSAVEEKKLERRSWQERRSLYLSFEDTPLFPGWGTHFAYVYAGTPPQRVSVIIDTGSHFTAFPCSECGNCGSHTDPPWNHAKSSSSQIVTCEKCHGSFRFVQGGKVLYLSSEMRRVRAVPVQLREDFVLLFHRIALTSVLYAQVLVRAVSFSNGLWQMA